MRPGVTWMIVGAVAVIGIFAGLDALRSSGDETPPAEATTTDAASATTQTERDAELPSSRQLQTRLIVRLIPGRVTTNERFPVAVTFTVPPGWYGSQVETGFVLGMGLVGEEVDLVPGGITVYVLDSTLAQADKRLEEVEGIRVKSSVGIGGAPGRRFAARLGFPREVLLHDLGLPNVHATSSPDLILLGAGDKTLVIQRRFTTDADGAEVNGVLKSFRVTTHEQEVEQAANEWAQLFAGDRDRAAPGTCEYMTQPGCERINCERVGGPPIESCRPPSWQFRKSFVDATVVATVIKDEQAAARFSNGETVSMEVGGTGSWWIHRFGGNAGRDLLERPN
jgi:hypothetical protein